MLAPADTSHANTHAWRECKQTQSQHCFLSWSKHRTWPRCQLPKLSCSFVPGTKPSITTFLEYLLCNSSGGFWYYNLGQAVSRNKFWQMFLKWSSPVRWLDAYLTYYCWVRRGGTRLAAQAFKISVICVFHNSNTESDVFFSFLYSQMCLQVLALMSCVLYRVSQSHFDMLRYNRNVRHSEQSFWRLSGTHT